MTKREKDIIRLMACYKCGSKPPFADGSRCHTHRIVRGKDGGQYLVGNVIPLCPQCHRAEDKIVMITAAFVGGKKGGTRTHELYPTLSREICRVLGKSKAGVNALIERKRTIGLTEAEMTHARMHIRRYASVGGKKGYKIGIGKLTSKELSQNGKKGGRKGIAALYAKLTPEERSANARKGALAANASIAKRKLEARNGR